MTVSLDESACQTIVENKAFLCSKSRSSLWVGQHIVCARDKVDIRPDYSVYVCGLAVIMQKPDQLQKKLISVSMQLHKADVV